MPFVLGTVLSKWKLRVFVEWLGARSVECVLCVSVYPWSPRMKKGDSVWDETNIIVTKETVMCTKEEIERACRCRYLKGVSIIDTSCVYLIA